MKKHIINVTTLVALADSQLNAELKEAGCNIITNDAELNEAINSMVAEEKASKLKEAARSIVVTMEASNHAIADLVMTLRAIRSKERDVLAKIKAINEAKEYAAETRNYLPLLNAMEHLDIDTRGVNAALVVPADFKPSKKAAKK